MEYVRHEAYERNVLDVQILPALQFDSPHTIDDNSADHLFAALR
jgi:hypothetical protein